MASGAAAIWCFIFARETYAPVLLERKAKRLIKETGNQNLVSKLDLNITTAELWKRSLLRPMKLMFLSLICALMSLYLAIVYGIMYILFTTFTFVFEQKYGFSTNIVGLVYIGLGIGMLLGLVVVGIYSDKIIKMLANKHSNGELKPEYRLPMLMYSGPFIPAGLFIYGWAAQYEVQWAVPLFGTLLIGVGMLGAFMCLNTYLIDAFTRYAASAMAANTILRSIFGAVFPLFGLQMYGALGLGWGNSLLAFIAIGLCPIPFFFYWYGERIRTHPRFQVSL
jgi:MFS family permease